MASIDYKNHLQIDAVYRAGYTGSNVGVAIFDTGAFPHRDLTHLCYFKDYINHQDSFYDDSGHGTHVAGILASSRIGIAPDVNLYIIKVLDQKGEGKNEHILNGIDWILENKHNTDIRIINISIGTTLNHPSHHRALIEKVEQAWDAGIIVVCAAGNLGPMPGTITAPGVSKKVITVGSITEHHQYRKSRVYSGQGPTKLCIKKPDVLAPGSNIVSCLNKPIGYTTKSGTSMATPFVSGCLALLLQKEPHLTPKEVKLKLYETSIRSVDYTGQSWGLINPRGLLKV